MGDYQRYNKVAHFTPRLARTVHLYAVASPRRIVRIPACVTARPPRQLFRRPASLPHSQTASSTYTASLPYSHPVSLYTASQLVIHPPIHSPSKLPPKQPPTLNTFCLTFNFSDCFLLNLLSWKKISHPSLPSTQIPPVSLPNYLYQPFGHLDYQPSSQFQLYTPLPPNQQIPGIILESQSASQ